jgi:patatin-like phospholipase/acyl hydrolase
MPEPIKILSIDGGGIRGLIPALLLAEIEQRTGKPIADLFDFLAGTSTGGILALGLTMAGPDGKPKYSANQLVDLYEKEGDTIFPQSLLYKMRSKVGFLMDEKYPAKGIESVLQKYFGEALFRDALKELLITSYDIENHCPFFFKRWQQKENTVDAFQIAQVARATSAAPTYFEPYCLNTNDARQKYYALVDGGVFANNPTACAYAEAIRRLGEGRTITDFLVVSLGTGVSTKPILFSDAKDWGPAGWSRPLLDVIFDGVSDTVDYQLQQMLAVKDGPRRYYRFQARLNLDMDAMDDATPDNLRKLRLKAVELIRVNTAALDDLCRQL